GKTLAAQLRKEGKVSKKLADVVEASEWVAKVPEMARCSFFRVLERTGRFCTHTQAALNEVQATQLEEMATELKGWLAGEEATVTASPIALSPEEEAFYDSAFVQPVLLVGERGSGKTYLARQAAETYDAVFLEMHMHPSMEAWEF